IGSTTAYSSPGPPSHRAAARLLPPPPHLLGLNAPRRRRSEQRPRILQAPAASFGGHGDAPPHHRQYQLSHGRGVLIQQPPRCLRQQSLRSVPQSG
uniref:Uncharacterized protein n=1 Tax=Aegilops tauschii subsp. strangulata TaxID=200361 RepID=A0A453RIM5_AEGTS